MTVYTQIPPIEPGVSQKLAQWRAANYSDVRYKLNIALEKGAPLMKGDMEIRVNLTEEGARNALALDWRRTQFLKDKDLPYAEVYDVNGTSITQGSSDLQTFIVEEHLIISSQFLKKGENVIKINFASPVKTSGAAVTRYVDKEDGAEYIYSLFVPSDASTAFPVFDQPDLKARFTLTVVVGGGRGRPDWKVVSNTPGKSGFESTWATIWTFEETKPISTYVFAFAAGDFAEIDCRGETCPRPQTLNKDSVSGQGQAEPLQNSSDLPMKIYVRKSQAEKFKAHEKEVFRLNREGVKYLETYFDFKFPFPKYDLVLIPEFPFGGMEHAGATFLRESSVIFPSEPTANDFISRANVIFHEAAHQWFGDTVTMKWFDDLWLKEGFAEFMAYKTLEKTMPEYNAWKAFYERNKPLAYATDSTKGTTPIYQEIPNLSAAKSAYGNIVYRKAPSFLRQAEFYLGEDKFQTAVRAFLKKYQYKNAEWTDLVREFETGSGQDLKDWANVWVKERGMPTMRVFRNTIWMNAPPYSTDFIMLRQRGNFDNEGYWKERVKVLFLDKNQEKRVADFGFETNDRVNGHIKLAQVEKDDFLLVFPNYQDYGYGIFLLDEKSREYVLKNIRNEKDDFLRSMMWGTLWDSVREAELNPKDYVELAIKNIAVETDELTISTILSRLSTAMNYYMSEPPAVAGGSNTTDSNAKVNPSATADGSDKAGLSAQLENLLIEKMQNAPAIGQRITFYRAFLNVASTEKARNVLKDILSGKFGIDGFNCRGEACPRPQTSNNENVNGQGQAKTLQNAPTILKTKDKFDIVTKLTILGDAEAPKLLADLQKTETGDDAKRYAYAAGAAFPTKEAKEKYFNDFLNNKEISESWIESAFVPFNSPRHAELTLPYLEKALAELPNLKRNRKIFFVNGWLAAFIGGQKDEKALAIISKFLAGNPQLDKDLRLKILENADVVERAVKIRRKW